MNKESWLIWSRGLFCILVIFLSAMDVFGDVPPDAQLAVTSGYVIVQRSKSSFKITDTKEPVKLYRGDILTANSDTKAVAYADSGSGSWMEILKPNRPWIVPGLSNPTQSSSSLWSTLANSLFRWNPREDGSLGGIKGDEEEVAPLSAAFPEHNSIVVSGQPYLVWNSDKSTYEVTLYQDGNVIFKRKVVNRYYLAFPDNIVGLKSGPIYHWRIIDLNNIYLDDSSSFTVYSRKEKNKILDGVNKLRIRLKDRGYSDDLLAFAVAGYLHQHGYNHSALEELIRGSEIYHDNKLYVLMIKQLIGEDNDD